MAKVKAETGMFGQVETVPIDSVQPHPRNARQGDVGAIVESIQKNGVYRPLFTDERTGNILAGTHTWRALKANGATDVKVIRITTRDEDHALRIMLVDNRVNDLASYDDQALVSLLEELALSDVRLEGTGFDGDALDDLRMKLNVPGLDLLASKFGEPLADALWPVIRIKVSPELFERWATAFKAAGPGTDADRVARMLDHIDLEAMKGSE